LSEASAKRECNIAHDSWRAIGASGEARRPIIRRTTSIAPPYPPPYWFSNPRLFTDFELKCEGTPTIVFFENGKAGIKIGPLEVPVTTDGELV